MTVIVFDCTSTLQEIPGLSHDRGGYDGVQKGGLLVLLLHGHLLRPAQHGVVIVQQGDEFRIGRLRQQRIIHSSEEPNTGQSVLSIQIRTLPVSYSNSRQFFPLFFPFLCFYSHFTRLNHDSLRVSPSRVAARVNSPIELLLSGVTALVQFIQILPVRTWKNRNYSAQFPIRNGYCPD